MTSNWFNFILFFFITAIVLPNNSQAKSDVSEKQVKIALRHVGHDILLSSGDSTSLVLPIERTLIGYTIKFQSEFEFLPGEVTQAIQKNLEIYNITNDYYVEVENCSTKEIIYSYQFLNTTVLDNIPCQKRFQSKGCYLVHISFVDLNEPSNYLSEFIIGLLILAALLLVYFFKSSKPTKEKIIDPNVISIGDYLFDNTKMTLIYKGDIVELSSKETDLLFVLFSNKNKVVERETILQLVWGDEGDYVGRTLDVFVSKLRKKLAEDSNIKIVNIRGIGYKLIE